MKIADRLISPVDRLISQADLAVFQNGRFIF
jgi:hypothetical protein